MSPFHPIFEEIRIGIGTWSWGDRLVWGYGDGYAETEIHDAFVESISSGVRFFDTAEVYGQGKSETMLGKLLAGVDQKIIIASKMMPFPWRLGRHALRNALTNSLKRLSLPKVDLYQMHWPLPPVGVDTWMNHMADACEAGLVDAVGVSNYSLEQTRTAHETLKKRGLRLASNQVEYHLLERRIETNGLKEYCDQEEIRIIAYSPLAMGILTGKYSPENPPRGTRASQYNRDYLRRIQPLLKTMMRIGNEHDGKTAGQVAINWTIQKNTLPIPGAKTASQAAQNAGAVDWALNLDDVALLDEISLEVLKPS
jgi:aryl-alcohol dehydrogenase-like predicted oxidoreductase